MPNRNQDHNAAQIAPRTPTKAYAARPVQPTQRSDRAQRVWGEVDIKLMADAVISCTHCGAAVLFGSTRDGGTPTLSLFLGDERARFYPIDAADCIRVLESFVYWSQQDDLNCDLGYFTG